MAITRTVLGGILQLELAALRMANVRTTLAHNAASTTLLGQFCAVLLASRLGITLFVIGQLLPVGLRIALVEVCR